MCACRLGEFIKDSTVKALMEIAEAYSCKLRSVQGPLAGVPELCGAQGTEVAAEPRKHAERHKEGIVGVQLQRRPAPATGRIMDECRLRRRAAE
ncbi:hypothetical protein ZWY2020_002543 [Hordeum vulgare]|nr:hypothetical protein ZWY2020_002543 [Hordeum vulgare]